MADKLKPSNFKAHPYDSVLSKSECETVARNIMVILSRTGDEFRPLKWEEYVEQRKIDGNFTESEKPYFERVINFCASPETAKVFSSVWAEVKQ